DAAGDATPRAIRQPRLAFEGLVAFDLTLASRAWRKARALGLAPPARAGQRKAPQDRFVFIEHNDLATARRVLEGGKCERAVGEISRGGIQSAGGAGEAQRVFFNTPRTLSRPSWTPVARAKPVASARQFHWEWMEPCARGSGSTRRLRECSNSHVTLDGRPERGRSTRPGVPWCAKR